MLLYVRFKKPPGNSVLAGFPHPPSILYYLVPLYLIKYLKISHFIGYIHWCTGTRVLLPSFI